MAALLLAAQAKRGSSDICRSQRAAIILAWRNTSDVQQETITKQSGGKHSEPVSGSAPPEPSLLDVCIRVFPGIKRSLWWGG